MVERNRTQTNRRGYLGIVAGLAATPALGSLAGADPGTSQSGYSNVVNIVEAGADNDGNESIEPVLEEVADDDTLIEFPEGEYLMDGTFRIAGYDKFGMVGEDATIDVAPTDDYVFKLGVYDNPIGDLRVEGFTVDISSSNTGGRAFEFQASDNLYAGDIEISGEHDTAGGLGPMLAGLQSDDGEGLVENVSMPDGGADVGGGAGGTGLLVSNYHEGSLTIRDAHIGPFPDNGIYCSSDTGHVTVEGGLIENANVAGVRLRGDDSSIDGTEFVYDRSYDGFGGQRPIRLDGGANLQVDNVDIDMSVSETEAIRVMSAVDSATISDSTMDLNGVVRDAIAITGGAEDVEVENVDVSGAERYKVFNN